MKPLDAILTLLLPSLIVVHLLVAPYTKVEESFNIQATHDILVYGTPTSDINRKLTTTYDHASFPGAVPRTFVGAVLLAGLSQPIIGVLGFRYAQIIARAVLGLCNGASLLFFASGLERAFGRGVRRWFIALVASQFHVVFYASRTLPNMFAFGLTTCAFTLLLPRPGEQPTSTHIRQRKAISLLVFSTAVFRSEIAVLLATTGLYLLATRQITIPRLIPPFLISFCVALAVSVPIDSYFWQKPLWPELWGFYYNAVLGSSSNWGVSPWHYYFTSALPRLFINPLAPLVLIPIALYHPATSLPARALVLPSMLFVAIYSLQPHKEARFIFYVVPPLTAAAALGANVIFSRRAKSTAYATGSAALVASILASFAASTGMLALSSLNYPGGEALDALYSLVAESTTSADTGTTVSVYADVLSCMTGVTLFGQNVVGLPIAAAKDSRRRVQLARQAKDRNGGVIPVVFEFDKTEEPIKLRDPLFWKRFDYLLVEDPEAVRGGEWEEVGVVHGYAGVEILRPERTDVEAGKPQGEVERSNVLGKGRWIASLRETLRRYTGGWWVGPRMAPRIKILRRVRDLDRKGREQEEASA